MTDAAEALERTVAEIEALQAIYDQDFVVQSHSELAAAVEAIENGKAIEIPLRFTLQVNEDGLTLQCTLPPGYPIMSPAKVSVQGGRIRKEQDYLMRKLQANANELVGQEAILLLAHELVSLVDEMESRSTITAEEQETTSEIESLSRRWIWVHHITDTARRKSIVTEATELQLGGILKTGYPGIVVVEGRRCTEFVNWIKGSKSRPGGFGRNWGHHVKGEVEIEERKLPLDFVELEDMRDLGAACRQHGLEDEFLEYVMQHK